MYSLLKIYEKVTQDVRKCQWHGSLLVRAILQRLHFRYAHHALYA